MTTRYGSGAELSIRKERSFSFDVDAEMIVYGSAQTDSHITLGGEPVSLRPDGTFTVRLSMPDQRQVLPIVCRHCGAEMKPVAVILDPDSLARICAHLGQPQGIPKLTPARGPPQVDFDFGA